MRPTNGEGRKRLIHEQKTDLATPGSQLTRLKFIQRSWVFLHLDIVNVRRAKKCR